MTIVERERNMRRREIFCENMKREIKLAVLISISNESSGLLWDYWQRYGNSTSEAHTLNDEWKFNFEIKTVVNELANKFRNLSLFVIWRIICGDDCLCCVLFAS